MLAKISVKFIEIKWLDIKAILNWNVREQMENFLAVKIDIK